MTILLLFVHKRGQLNYVHFHFFIEFQGPFSDRDKKIVHNSLTFLLLEIKKFKQQIITYPTRNRNPPCIYGHTQETIIWSKKLFLLFSFTKVIIIMHCASLHYYRIFLLDNTGKIYSEDLPHTRTMLPPLISLATFTVSKNRDIKVSHCFLHRTHRTMYSVEAVSGSFHKKL